jgi:hypothetical protein
MGLPQRIITFGTCVYFIMKSDVSFRHYSNKGIYLVQIYKKQVYRVRYDNTLFQPEPSTRNDHAISVMVTGSDYAICWPRQKAIREERKKN